MPSSVTFAPIQAAWARDGWTVCEKPEYAFIVHPFSGEAAGVAVKGSIDRIDAKPGAGFRIIDYKSWDKISSARSHVFAGGARQLEFAAALGLPAVDGAGRTPKRIVSVQLPLYAACLAASAAKYASAPVDLCYLVLGAGEAGVYGGGGATGLQLADFAGAAMETAERAAAAIAKGLFWPPGPGGEWERDFKHLFAAGPFKDVPPGTPWRDAMEGALR